MPAATVAHLCAGRKLSYMSLKVRLRSRCRALLYNTLLIPSRVLSPLSLPGQLVSAADVLMDRWGPAGGPEHFRSLSSRSGASRLRHGLCGIQGAPGSWAGFKLLGYRAWK